MPCGGRRNKLGSLHGPQNEENINGTHPAMLAALHCNSDVQLPYRFGISEHTHCASACNEQCVDTVRFKEVVEAAQNAQDAQAGYACDYQNKRAARSCNEVKECVKGHRQLHADLKNEPPAYIGKRHVTRLCSDAYGKGIVRSNQESTNLRIYSKSHDVTAAESFHTSQTTVFPGRDLTLWREAVYERREYVEALGALEIDCRNPGTKKDSQTK